MTLRTFNIELVMDEAVAAHWLNLLIQTRDAYNFCSKTAVSEAIPLSLKPFHDALYSRTRERFPSLPAQTVIKVYKDVLSALRSIKKNKHEDAKTPHKYGLSMRLDKRLYSRMDSSGIVITGAESRKRVLCSFVLFDKVKELFATHPTQDPTIFYREGRFFLAVPFECSVPPAEGDSALGVDLGMRRLFVTSEGKTFVDKKYLTRRRRVRFLKTKLKEKGTKSAKRHLKNLKHREKNLSKDMVERATSALLKSSDASTLVLEDLKKLKKKTSKTAEGVKRTKHNSAISQVPFYKFKERLTQKAALLGKQVKTVSPAFTSQTDSRTNKRDGQRKGCRYYCSDGVVLDADWNAAVNIALRSKLPTSSALPIDGGLVPLVGRHQSMCRYAEGL